MVELELRLPDEILELARRHAKETGVSLDEFIIQAVKDYTRQVERKDEALQAARNLKERFEQIGTVKPNPGGGDDE